jgi:hypothetical protein
MVKSQIKGVGKDKSITLDGKEMLITSYLKTLPEETLQTAYMRFIKKYDNYDDDGDWLLQYWHSQSVMLNVVRSLLDGHAISDEDLSQIADALIGRRNYRNVCTFHKDRGLETYQSKKNNVQGQYFRPKDLYNLDYGRESLQIHGMRRKSDFWKNLNQL